METRLPDLAIRAGEVPSSTLGAPDWLENREDQRTRPTSPKGWASRDGIRAGWSGLFVGLETANGQRGTKGTAKGPRHPPKGRVDAGRRVGKARAFLSLPVGLVGHAGAALGAGAGWEEGVQQGAEGDIALCWKCYG